MYGKLKLVIKMANLWDFCEPRKQGLKLIIGLGDQTMPAI